MRDSLLRFLVVLVFFVSGAAGLVYQVLWTRQLALIFGVTTYAVATVLATFMGGLALGSYLFGARSDRYRNPLVAYGILEIGIGLYALVMPWLFAALREPSIYLHGLETSREVIALARVVLTAGVLAVPTTLMGGTFPILTRFIVTAPGQVGRGAGLLYFINTAGAIFGCLFAGFWALENLGLRGTGNLAAMLNFAVGIAALGLARMARPTDVVAPQPAAEAVVEDARGPLPPVSLVLACAAVSGFTSIAYEVLWSRALLRYLYNSTYAFTTMLATFLAGIAVGSALYVAVLRRIGRPVWVLATLQLLVGIGFAVSAVLFAHMPAISAAIRGGDTVVSFGDSLRMMFLHSFLILFVPTIFLGAAFPLATDLCARGLARLGRTIGRVYAVNTFGAILGSLACAFVLIPGLGMQGTLTLLILVNGASAMALGWASRAPAGRRVAGTAAFGVAMGIAVAVLPADLFRRTFVRPPQQVVYYREGATDTVGVVEGYEQRHIQYEDLRGTAGTLSFRWNYFFGHFPMLIHPGIPRHVLHICFGVGNSLSAIVRHPELERVDNVELSPHVVDAADYFWTNDGVIHHPKVRTIIDDGRNYVMATDEQYDLIAMEPPETFTAGVIHLYTREFYRTCLPSWRRTAS